MPAAENVILKKFLELLKKEQAGMIALLATPNDKSAFGYGQASGRLLGLHRAERLFTEVIGEEEDRTENG
jgi:hypothetical protein